MRGRVGLLVGLPLLAGRTDSTIDPASCLHLQTAEELRLVLPSPLYHCLGSVGGTMVSMMYGVTLLLSSPSFNGKKALEAISKEKWALVEKPPVG